MHLRLYFVITATFCIKQIFTRFMPFVIQVFVHAFC